MTPFSRSRSAWVACLCLGAYALCSLAFWTARDWRPEWDGAVYVLVARSLAAGEGYLYQGEPFFLRPPGLSWLLSLLVGGEGFDPYPVNLLLMGFGAAAVCAIYAALRQVEGGAYALLVALLTGTSLLFGQLFNSIFAEFPFATFSFLAIAALERSWRPERPARPGRARGRWWTWALAGGLCLALAMMMRTVAVLLLPGVLLLPALRGAGRGRWRGIPPVLLALVLTAPWWRYARAAAAAAEVPVEQDLLYDYTTALFHVDPGDPASAFVDLGGWIERLSTHGSALLADLTASTLHLPASVPLQVVFLLALVAGVVVTIRRRGLSLFEWLGLVYVPLVATYFVYDARLVMPLVPLVYGYLIDGLRALVARLAPAQRAPSITWAAGLVLLGANVLFLGRDLARRTHVGAIDAEIAQGVLEHTPEDARILCNQAPTMALLTGRRTFTYRFVRSADILAKYEIDYVLYDTPGTPPPLQRMVDERRLERWVIPFGKGRRTLLTRVR